MSFYITYIFTRKNILDFHFFFLWGPQICIFSALNFLSDKACSMSLLLQSDSKQAVLMSVKMPLLSAPLSWWLHLPAPWQPVRGQVSTSRALHPSVLWVWHSWSIQQSLCHHQEVMAVSFRHQGVNLTKHSIFIPSVLTGLSSDT